MTSEHDKALLLDLLCYCYNISNDNDFQVLARKIASFTNNRK